MICCVVVLFILTRIVLLRVWHNTESRCTVKVEDDLFSIGMESMNESRSESFQLEDGRYTMTVEGERAKGSISFQILRKEE